MRLEQAFHWVAWNIFLALVPVVAAYSIYFLTKFWAKTKLVFFPITLLALVWLAFLPNSCYLLTEWRHFFEILDAFDVYMRARGNPELTLNLMKHTVFYFFYSGIGMLAFTLAIRPIVRVVRGSGISLWVLAFPFFLMLSVGVYLGLILRFNSWDLIYRPDQIWSAITDLASRPRLSAFLAAFACFLWIAYVAIDAWVDGLKLKWRKAVS